MNTDNKQEFINSDQDNINTKSYYCPHCKKVIMKGHVKRLNMTCPNCQELINADEAELLENNDENKKQK